MANATTYTFDIILTFDLVNLSHADVTHRQCAMSHAALVHNQTHDMHLCLQNQESNTTAER